MYDKYAFMTTKEKEKELERRIGGKIRYMESDRVFKAVVKENINTVISSFPEFSNLKDEKFEILDSEINFGVSARTLNLDIHCCVVENMMEFDIEMEQNKKPVSFEMRMIHYFISMMLKNIPRGELSYPYVNKKCYVIAFVGYNLFNDDLAIHEITFKDLIDDHVPYNGKIIFVCLTNYQKCDNIRLRRLAEIIQSTDFKPNRGDDSLMSKFVSDIKKTLSDEEIKNLSVKEQLEYYDYISGFEIEHKRGYDEGLEEGLEQGVINTIKSMNENNISIKDIAKITNKSIDEVNKILNI